jgi:serine O-acetyltransferase
MKLEISKEQTIEGLVNQLKSFFIITNNEIDLITSISEQVFNRCEYCFSKTLNKYYSREGVVYFNPYHSAQYTIFLYFFSNSLFQLNSDYSILADKFYYLNKIMNACDLFYEIELPEVFMLDHPVGSVMGRAIYNDYFSFGQNCTVGNNNNIFPVIGKNVKMSASSMILGDSNIGENSIIGAGACVKDQNIPANSIVFGNSPNLIIKDRK